MMELRGICREYKVGTETVRALDHVDLTIAPGEYLSIMGPSGSGKSTLLNVLGLLDRPTAGTYRLEGVDVMVNNAGIGGSAFSWEMTLAQWQKMIDIDLTAVFLGCKAVLPAAHWTALKPALVEGGRRWWLAELRDEAAVRGFVPDSYAIAALARETGSLGLCLFARRAAPHAGLVVRAFPLGVGIPEDPASGAANAAIAAFLHETDNLHGLGRR